MIFHTPRLQRIWATGGLLFGMLLLPCSATPQSPLSVDDCRPLVFPSGDVVRRERQIQIDVRTIPRLWRVSKGTV